MSNLLRKRCPTASGVQIGSSSCRRSDHCQICKLMDLHSEEAVTYRCNKDISRHCEGVSRCMCPSQIVFGMYQCTDQALRSEFPHQIAAAPLTHSSQESKGVEEKLVDLIPWLTKLKASVTMTPDEGGDDAERREELMWCVSHACYPNNFKPIICTRSLEGIEK